MPKFTSLQFIEDQVTQQLKDHETDESFFVFDLEDVSRKIQNWRKLLPRVTPFYAVKCNSDIKIIERMQKLGINFDCASFPEMEKVLEVGGSPSQIIYANPCKQISHLKKAQAAGINLTTFDNADELKKIKDHAPNMEVVLRLATDDSKAICALSNKFGAKMDDVEPLLKKVQKLELTFAGFSFHVGSGSEDENAFGAAIANARKAFDIANKLGLNPRMLDIGGGFPGESYDVKKSRKGFPLIAKNINAALDEYFDGMEVEFIAEPGRYCVGSSGTLVASVVARRKPFNLKKSDDGDVNFMYYISEGVYGAFNNTIYDHAHVNPKVLDVQATKIDHSKEFFSSLWGPTCDGLDCVIKGIPLPRLEVGSWLYFENMGAYTVAASTNFNGFNKANVYYIN